MTDRELRKLSRSDLLDLLLRQTREIEQLREELQEAEEQLASRRLAVDEAGSIAEASLQLNGVFEAAQSACAQYIENVRARSEEQERICIRMEQETREKCDRMLANARREADAYWAETTKKVDDLFAPYTGLRELLESVPSDSKTG